MNKIYNKIVSQNYYNKLIKREIIKKYRLDIDKIFNDFINSNNVSEIEVINVVSMLNTKLIQCFDEMNENNIPLSSCNIHYDDTWEHVKNSVFQKFRYKFSNILESYIIIEPECYEKMFLK